MIPNPNFIPKAKIPKSKIRRCGDSLEQCEGAGNQPQAIQHAPQPVPLTVLQGS